MVLESNGCCTECSGPRLPANAAPRPVSLPLTEQRSHVAFFAVDAHQRYPRAASFSDSTGEESDEEDGEEEDTSDKVEPQVIDENEVVEVSTSTPESSQANMHCSDLPVTEERSQHVQVLLSNADDIVALLSGRKSSMEESAQETEREPEASQHGLVKGKNSSHYPSQDVDLGDTETRPTFNCLLLALAAEHQRVVSEEKRHWTRSGTTKTTLSGKYGGGRSSSRKPTLQASTFPKDSGFWTPKRQHTLETGDLSTASPPTQASATTFTKSSRSRSKISLPSHGRKNSPQKTRPSWFNAQDSPEIGGQKSEAAAARRLSAMVGWEQTGAEGFNFRQLCHSLGGIQTLDTISTFVILLNMALIGWLAELSVSSAESGVMEEETSPAIQVLTTFFTVWFVLELMMRMWLNGFRKFFCCCDWAWNWFDLLVVVTDLALTSLQYLGLGMGSPLQNLTVVKMLRVLKITRAVRVLRLVRLFRDLRMMLFSIVESGSALFWSLVLLFLTIYAFAIYFMQVLAFELEPTGAGEHQDMATREQLKFLFGSLAQSSHTLYQSVSGGVSWGEVSNLLAKVHFAHTIVFCGYIFFTIFALLNIITGVFVETSINSARNNREEVAQEQLVATKDLVHDMREMFSKADEDKSGTINVYEFETYLHQAEVRVYLKTLGIEVDRARSLFQLLDLDESGEISVDEFIFGCLRLKGQAKAIDLATLTGHVKRMSKEVKDYCKWSEKQFENLQVAQKNLDERLAFLSLEGDDAATPCTNSEEPMMQQDEGDGEDEEDEECEGEDTDGDAEADTDREDEAQQ